MRPEIIAAIISGVIGGMCILIATLISRRVSSRATEKQSELGEKQIRLGYIQAMLANEAIARNYKFFCRQINILKTYYQLFPPEANFTLDLSNNDVEANLEIVFAYLEDRLASRKQKLEKYGEQLRPYEQRILELIRNRKIANKMSGDPVILEDFKLCVNDAHRYFCAKTGEGWFSALFGSAPNLHEQIMNMARSSTNWRDDPTQWDKLSQLLEKFVAGNW